MGKKLIIKGADFSENGINSQYIDLPIEWHGILGSEGVAHFIQIASNGAVVLYNKYLRSNTTNGKRRSFGIVDVSQYAGRTLRLCYSKNKSQSNFYAAFASAINSETLATDLDTSLSNNTMSGLQTSAFTIISGERWNNTTDSTVVLTDLCDPFTKVVPNDAHYLVFDHIVGDGVNTFEGIIQVLPES